jgi:hypothetical protein
MSEKTNTQPEVLAVNQTIQDFKHASLILSVSINVAIFMVWILAHAGAGTI